ncbi:hypothetical protein WJX73_005878 [Symbiochloris irregularis]|uniref:Uncharacterized protein n=1 Tax=Symbiochloris irregularis TaxID=706552 RepID=A0AAW1P6E4_9CHLO
MVVFTGQQRQRVVFTASTAKKNNGQKTSSTLPGKRIVTVAGQSKPGTLDERFSRLQNLQQQADKLQKDKRSELLDEKRGNQPAAQQERVVIAGKKAETRKATQPRGRTVFVKQKAASVSSKSDQQHKPAKQQRWKQRKVSQAPASSK